MNDPRCKKCGGVDREFLRANRHRTGLSYHRVCCCCHRDEWLKPNIRLTLSGLSLCTGCYGPGAPFPNTQYKSLGGVNGVHEITWVARSDIGACSEDPYTIEQHASLITFSPAFDYAANGDPALNCSDLNGGVTKTTMYFDVTRRQKGPSDTDPLDCSILYAHIYLESGPTLTVFKYDAGNTSGNNCAKPYPQLGVSFSNDLGVSDCDNTTAANGGSLKIEMFDDP